jgi:hypothetical protein
MNIDEGSPALGPDVKESGGLKLAQTGDTSVSLQEIEMVFPLKKLVQFAKAHCLDSNVCIHLDEKGYLILQYNIKIYGELRFVVASTRDDNDDDDENDRSESDDSDAPNTTTKQGGQKRPRNESDDDDE